MANLNFIMHRSRIKSGRDTIIKNIIHGSSEQGLHALRLEVSLGAIHDSAARHPAPNCHSDTRKAVQQIIKDWIHNKSSASLFFWLYGPAGAGKTAILQAIAEFLYSSSKSDENYGGSFFFSRGENDRNQGRFLFSTIAYQLALIVPGLRGHVNRIMEANPTLPSKSMAVQLRSLIVDSFRCLSSLPRCPYLVIIDGLDECLDKATQQIILRLLCKASTDHKLPLRFLIGSRPEFQIRTVFDQESLYKITRRVVLDETFNPGRDIKVFLQDGFAKICAENADILSHVNQPWPERGVIDLLVQRSSGQFIYGATVLKFVGADFCNPTTQLALILKPDPTAFSDLDQLYTQILSVYPNTVDMVQVLGILVGFDARTLTPQVIGDILEMERGDVMLVLRCLSSLIAFVGDGEYREGSEVYFTHASFGDYLEDPNRSGPFHVNKRQCKNQATIKCFSLILRVIRSWRKPNRIPYSETWAYFENYLGFHFLNSKVVRDAIMTDIYDLVEEFWKISRGGAVMVDVSFTAMIRLLDILEWSKKYFLQEAASEHLIIIEDFQQMFDHSLSKSRELGDLLKFLPGIVVQHDLTMQGMADLYGVKMDLLEHLIKSRIQPLASTRDGYYTLTSSLSRFLEDRDRFPLSYCDFMLHHIYICRRFVALLDGSNTSDLQSDELSRYSQNFLHEHLCSATEILFSGQNISGDHPAIGLIKDLQRTRTTYYALNPNKFESHRGRLALDVTTAVLRWSDTLGHRLKDTAVSISNADLIKRACQVTDRIYRQTLCIKMDGSTKIVGFVRSTPGFNLKAVEHWPVIQMSWELLDVVWVDGGILRSFTDFITTPEISGPLYIRPDVYHTQIAEYSLETLYQLNNNRASPFNLHGDRVLKGYLDRRLEDHISRALPTKMIFYLLRSLTSSSSRSVPLDGIHSLGTIIIWLEGLGSNRPTDLYDRCRNIELTREKQNSKREEKKSRSRFYW